jgi:hypothetical protein
MSGREETTPLLRQRKPVADAPIQEKSNASRSDGALPVDEEVDVAHSWANPFAWPPAVYIALLLASAAIYWSKFLVEPDFDTATPALCRSTFDYGFRVNAARTQIERLSSHSWEYGTGLAGTLGAREDCLCTRTFPRRQDPETATEEAAGNSLDAAAHSHQRRADFVRRRLQQFGPCFVGRCSSHAGPEQHKDFPGRDEAEGLSSQ